MMTIKQKNRLIFVLIFIAMALLLTSITFFVLGLYTKTLALPISLPQVSLPNLFLFRYNFFCPFIAVFTLLTYMIISLIIMNIEFEKTQSSEIIYLTIFFIGILPEAAKLIFPILNLWNSNQSIAIYATRFILIGRMISVLSIFFASTCSKAEYRQFVERNIFIILAISFIFGLIYPVNTNVILPEGRFAWGMPVMFTTSYIAIFLLSFISQIIYASRENSNYCLPFGLLLISAGYYVLCGAWNFFAITTGFLSLAAGTILYLGRLHHIFLWND